MTRTALMISPYFVPVRYVGAKRTLNFARHLPSHDWQVAVVALPAEIDPDPTLLPLVPEVPLLRTLRGGPTAWAEDLGARLKRKPKPKSSGPKFGADASAKAPKRQGPLKRTLADLGGALGLFDRFTKHLPWALPGVVRFAKQHNCEIIYATAGPFSSVLLADLVQRLTGLPMVLDLRDPWSLEPNYRANWTPSGRRMVDAMEASHFARASKVILNTASAHAAYVEHYAGRLPAERFTFIRNQFDPDLYGAPGPAPQPGEPFRIVYYGHLRPTKNAVLFLEALAQFVAQRSLTPADLELVMLGNVTAQDQATYERLGLADFVHLKPWLPFTRSRELLGTADLLLDLMGPNHHLQISGKLYDYLAAGRPILSVSPNLELDDVFTRTGAGQRVDLTHAAIVAGLEHRYTRRFDPWAPNAEAVAQFGARAATAQLAGIFDEISQ
jgi:glycosyltransferase involved in cell wall biosynthesis